MTALPQAWGFRDPAASTSFLTGFWKPNTVLVSTSSCCPNCTLCQSICPMDVAHTKALLPLLSQSARSLPEVGTLLSSGVPPPLARTLLHGKRWPPRMSLTLAGLLAVPAASWGLWYQGPCKQAMQLTPISRCVGVRLALFVPPRSFSASEVSHRGTSIHSPHGRTRHRRPPVDVEDHLQFHSQVVCSVPLLEGPPTKKGLVQVRERLERDRSNVAADMMFKHHKAKRKSSDGVHSSGSTLRLPPRTRGRNRPVVLEPKWLRRLLSSSSSAGLWAEGRPPLPARRRRPRQVRKASGENAYTTKASFAISSKQTQPREQPRNKPNKLELQESNGGTGILAFR